MTESFVSPVLGTILGTWLLAAGLRKIVDPGPFEQMLNRLLGIQSPTWRASLVRRLLPWIELLLGAGACLLFDSLAVRGAVLILFLLFLVAVSKVALHVERFECGCLGAGQEEHRTLVIARTMAGLLLAGLWFMRPRSTQGSVGHELLWLYASAWSVALLMSIDVRRVLRTDDSEPDELDEGELA